MKTDLTLSLMLLLLALGSSSVFATAYEIPATTASAITVDGVLDELEWSTANWIPLDKPYYQTVTDAADAKWAAYWSPQSNLIFIAVTVVDSVPYLGAAYNEWDSYDAVEVYLDAGNQNAVAEDYADWNFDKAQHFIGGIQPTAGDWLVMSDGSSVPSDLVVAYAAGYTVSGSDYTYSYEFVIRPYSFYAGLGAGGTSEEVNLEVDTIIGLDVVLSSRYGAESNNFGMLCNNTVGGKYRFPQYFQDYTMVVSIGDENPLLETDAGYYSEKGDLLNAVQWHAQSYQPVKPYLYAVDICFEENKDVTGEFVLEIWENENDPNIAGEEDDPRIGSSPIATSTVSRLVTGSNPGFVRWTFSPVVDLSSYVGQSEKILFLVKADDTGISPMLNNLGDTPPFGYENGKYYFLTGTTNWFRVDNYDMAFRTLAVDDPEPLYEAVVDQSQAASTNGRPWNLTTLHGQSFEPQYPYLYAVKAPIGTATGGKMNIESSYTVEIWRHHGGRGTYEDPRIGSEPLGTATINYLRSIDRTGWITWQFAPPLDLSEYYLQRPQPLMILFKADPNNLVSYINTTNPYAGGNEYYVQGADDPDPLTWSWTKYIGNDMAFQTYGGYLATPVSCGWGTGLMPGDISTSNGLSVPDCKVDIYDLHVFANQWLDCSDPQDPECNSFYR